MLTYPSFTRGMFLELLYSQCNVILLPIYRRMLQTNNVIVLRYQAELVIIFQAMTPSLLSLPKLVLVSMSHVLFLLTWNQL
jgi:hypothetical protein